MPLNSMGLGFLFTAQNLASATFKQVQNDLIETQKKAAGTSVAIEQGMKQVKAGTMLAGAGAAGLAVSFSLAGVAGQFERAVAGVAAVSKASTVELERMREAALAAGQATSFTPTEAVMGLQQLTQAGLSATEAIDVLQPSLDLAAGSLGELGVSQAADMAVQAMKAFGIQADQTTGAVDKMLSSVNAFAISAGELPLALGIGARGAAALNASLEDTLISLGLAKNIMPSVERASTAVAVAMESLAQKETLAKLQSQFHVQAIDKATGKFRPFLDVMQDVMGATSKMTESQRALAIGSIFGNRATGGLNAIMTQLRNGIKTTSGEMLKGAAAIAYLRKQMADSAGTAADFRSKMADTYEGQKGLLKSTLATAAIVFGEPFARVLKPLVTLVKDGVDIVIAAFKRLPKGVQNAIAGLVLVASTLASIVGTVLLVKGGMALLGVTIGGLASLIGSAVLSVLPFLLAIGAVIGAIALLRLAWTKNLGGIADFGKKVWDKITLFYDALVQVFSQGGFSGAVMKELGKIENQGLKQFVINIYLVWNRLKAFFSGIGEGFAGAFAAFGPMLEALIQAFMELGAALGMAFAGPNDPAANVTAFQAWATAGQMLGKAIAGIAETMINLLIPAVKIVTASIAAFRGDVAETSMPFKVLGAVIGGIANIMIGSLKASADMFYALFVAPIKGGIFLINGLLTGDFAKAWYGVKLIVYEVVTGIISSTLAMVEAIARIVDSVGAMAGKSIGAAKAVGDLRGWVETSFRPTAPASAAGGSVAPAAVATVAAERPVAAGQAMNPEQLGEWLRQLASRPIVLEVDGEAIASASSKGAAMALGRGFGRGGM
jgi:TP901 family phage tail tape measure protein